MKAIAFKKLLTKLGNVLLALCLLALNSGPVSVADALTIQENNTIAAIKNPEAPLLGFMKGTQLVGTNTAFPSDSNEDGEDFGYVKQTGKTNFIGMPSSKFMIKNISTAAPVINNKILIDFSPYIDGQDPNSGTGLPENQIRQRMDIIEPYSKWIRSFSCGNGLEVIGPIAHEKNLKVAVNAWIGKSDVVNQQQIACLIDQANAGHVDLAIVGSEALLRGDVTPDALIGYIDQVRQAIPSSIPVTTADVYGTFLGNPLLVDHIDLIFANIYPFWEGYKVQYGVAMLNYYYNQLVTTYPTKTIEISETGWPSCGSHGDAIGSLTNEALYFSRVESWAYDKNVTMFYFDGLDESWKAKYEGPLGGCWGIWDKNGVMKDGMSPVFDGTRVPYDLNLPATCETSQFSFNFTYVPQYASFENILGKTCGIFHKDYKIMLYIKVNGNWWVKPYDYQPTTSINPDGTWSVDYTTGGIDELATEIRAYLIPTKEVGSCNAISDSCGYLMISVTRPTDPNAFDKSSPANGATNQPTSPILSWGSILNATSYEYCYDTTNENACSNNWISAGSNTSLALSALTPSTTYYWQVRATNPNGTTYANGGMWWPFTTHPNTDIIISGNAGIGGATLSYTDGTSKTATADENGAYSFAVPYNWAGIVTPSRSGYTFTPFSKSYSNVQSNQNGQNYTATACAGCADISVLIGGTNQGRFGLPAHGSTRQSFGGVNNGPVQIASTNAVSLIAAERVIYAVNGVYTSFSEMMALPNSQLSTTYWLPWYNNVDLDTQLRFGNVSANPATVHVFIGGAEVTPLAGISLAVGASTRVSYTGVNNGPVKVVSDQNIVAAERVIYAVNGVYTSFSEMMALPNSQLNTTYWLPWYNNVDLDTQLRIGNVSASPATVHVYIGGAEVTPLAGISLGVGASTRVSYVGVNDGPVKIVSDQNIVAAERVLYAVNGVNTSFSEMMALPNGQLNTTYVLPWYNNVDLDTQLRFGNVSANPATVHVYIGGTEVTPPAGISLAVGASTRVSYVGVNNGPVKVISDQNIVVAERVIYKVNGVYTSFSEMMALPNSLLNTTYWLPWYNNVDLDTQLRFGPP